MCARLHAPIVLAHGLFGFKQINLGPLRLTTYFRGIPEWLSASGNRVLVTKVPPIAGIGQRARILANEIESAFPDEPVHIIGHSSGGLDARWLLTDASWRSHILSLTTIGTPHLGSAIADFAKIRFGRIYNQLTALGVDHRGFVDVTRRAARAFHRQAPAPLDLPCFSIAGDPTEEDVCWPLRRLHTALHELEGPNDGLVSVESALAFGQNLAVSHMDHLRQMNWFAHESDSMNPPAFDLFGQIIENLVHQGFGASEPDLFGVHAGAVMIPS